MQDKIFDDSRFVSDPIGPPDTPGVYAICVIDRSHMRDIKVVYIGTSNNILRRVLNGEHIYRRLVNILKGYCVACFAFECEDRISLERELIKKYTPRFNRQYNG